MSERSPWRIWTLSLFGAFAFAVGALTTTAGCNEVDAAFDCQSICSRYKDCYNSNFNVPACRDGCRAKASADSSFRAKADMCEACIDDGTSCSAATFQCGATCGEIIVAS